MSEGYEPGANVAQIDRVKGDPIAREIVRLAAADMTPEQIAEQLHRPLKSVKISIGMREKQIEAERERLKTRRLDGTLIINAPEPIRRPEPAVHEPATRPTEPTRTAPIRVSMVTLLGAAHTYVVTRGKVDIDGALSIPTGDVEAIAHELKAVLAQASAMDMA